MNSHTSYLLQNSVSDADELSLSLLAIQSSIWKSCARCSARFRTGQNTWESWQCPVPQPRQAGQGSPIETRGVCAAQEQRGRPRSPSPAEAAPAWPGLLTPARLGETRRTRAARLLKRGGDVSWKTLGGPGWCKRVTEARGLTWQGVPCPKAAASGATSSSPPSRRAASPGLPRHNHGPVQRTALRGRSHPPPGGPRGFG